MCEIWKDVNGYEGFYQVSNYGRVRSLDHYASNGRADILYKGRIIKPKLFPNGYVHVQLHRPGKKVKMAYIHRLVASAFIPNPEDKPEVNHLDENKLNNHVNNLAWCTSSENHMYNNLHVRIGLKKRGVVINNKPIIQLTMDGKEVARWPSAMEAWRQTGIDYSHIRKATRGIISSAGGFKWQQNNL